jgi:hypothetical protein
MQEPLRCESRPGRVRRPRGGGGLWRLSLGFMILGGGLLDAAWLAPAREQRTSVRPSVEQVHFEAMRRCRTLRHATAAALTPAAATAAGTVISGPDYIEVDVITTDAK